MGRSSLHAAFADPRVLRGPLPWVLGLFVAANVAASMTERHWEAERQANLLAPTIHVTSRAPRFDWSVGEHLDQYWNHLPDGRSQPLTIVAGMSQMYAINDEKAGDFIIAEWIDEALQPTGARAFGLAAPNLDNEEALLYLAATATDPNVRPSTFVYGLCFDKFRNVDVRPGLMAFMRSRPATAAAWASLCSTGNAAATYPAACEKIRTTYEALGAKSESADDDATGVEATIRAEAARLIPVVSARKELNAAFQLQAFMLRNFLFHIKSSTKRPMIQSRYELNQEFVGLLADVARLHGVQLVLYVIPLNPLAENPYVASEYEAFKVWASEFAASRNIPFANFEHLVPEDEWGEVAGEPDFKHFREPGHHRVAQAVVDRFGSLLRRDTHGAVASP